jgi:hypothetical protein
MLGEASYKLAASRDRFGLGALPHCRPRSSSCSRLASRAGWALPVGRCPVWAMCVVLCGWRCVWAVCASPECSWAGRVVHFESIGERDPSPLSVELGSLGLGSPNGSIFFPRQNVLAEEENRPVWRARTTRLERASKWLTGRSTSLQGR